MEASHSVKLVRCGIQSYIGSDQKVYSQPAHRFSNLAPFGMQCMKITLVGGGSFAWTPAIVKDMLMSPALRGAEFVLYDINRAASDLTKAYLDTAAERMGIQASIVSTDRQAAALDHADYVIITISTGGLEAMRHDLAIPEKFGVYHTVGDTCGPGGWARTIRNFDTFMAMAQAFNRHCPKAMILNYTNPMITLTDVLARVCKGPVIGLCHGLFENLRFIRQFYKLKSEDEISVKYAGINHFFWTTQARARGVDVIADLKSRLKTKGFSELLREPHMDRLGFKSNREVATELFRQTGVMPYLGDRHTCEWFPRYITSRENMRKHKIERTPISDRVKWRRDAEKLLRNRIAGKGWPDKFERTRETAADIIEAHSQGKVFIDVGNLPNIGQISNLPVGAVVETAVRVDRNGFSPIAFGPLPEPVRAVVAPWCHVMTMLVDAIFARDRRQVMQALRLDPVCAGLNDQQVDAMGNQLLKAHQKFIARI
jgi:alpha-galactosidase